MSGSEDNISDVEKEDSMSLDETAPSEDVTIGESDVDSADESVLLIRPKSKKRAVVFESDDDDDDGDGDVNDASRSNDNNETDDEDGDGDVIDASQSDANNQTDDEDGDDNDELDRRAFSPRTRMSITGVRPVDLTDESSEIDSSDDEVMQRKSVEDTNKSKKGSSSENDYQSAEDTTVEAGVTSSINKPTRRNASTIEECSLERLKETSLVKNSLYVSKPDCNLNSPAPPRYSNIFESGIKNKLSSTINQTHELTQIESSDDSSDLQILSKKEELIEISSSDDEHISYRNIKIPSISTPQPPKPLRPLVQPKISAAVSSIQSSTKKTPSRKMPAKQYVSQEYYNKEAKKFDELRLELLNAEKLMAKIAITLPDGGRQLQLRIDRLRTDKQIKANYFDSLVVENDNVPLRQMPQFQQEHKKPGLSTDAPNWDELSAAVNKIQPLHTGKQGLATFNNQKALTVDRLKDLHGSLENCPDENVLADDPKGLKVTLMDHQKHALAWMNWREKQKPRGGILADDMGLGKTLSLISLVLADKNRLDTEQDEDEAREESDSEDVETNENIGWTSKGRRDFYQGNTLVVCPASLVRQWESEVQSKVSRHKLTVCVHHGSNRDTKPKHLRTYDMVITTYAIITSEKRNCGALFGIKWRRIILDEAHVIRNYKAQLSMGVCALRGKYRWALTGTPVQNKEMDVYALLKFLRCSPFDELVHWKRWIDNKSAGGQQRLSTIMKSLLLRRTKVQLQEKGQLDCLPEKHINIIDVELDKDEMNVYQKIMIYSRTLFAQYLFQRAERNTDLMYGVQANRPTYLQTKNPNGAYNKVHEKFTKLHKGSQDVKSHEILVLLLRLRQICCHPGLIDSMLEDTDSENMNSDSENTQPEIDLLEQLNQLAITDTSGNSSASNSLDGEHELPPEDQIVSKASAKVLQRNNPVFDFKRPSSKMNKVFETIQKKVINSNDKAIIVSQWTSVLNILRTHLGLQGINTLSLNGSIPVKDRQTIVNEFNDMNSNKKILLLSLTAGGVGLNLVGANHLLLIDLHWNPQLEAQAQDRIYRVGQTKCVNIYKFMCKGTVEERIKALQDQKLAVANGILTGAKASAGSKLSMDDLRGLFGM